MIDLTGQHVNVNCLINKKIETNTQLTRLLLCTTLYQLSSATSAVSAVAVSWNGWIFYVGSENEIVYFVSVVVLCERYIVKIMDGTVASGIVFILVGLVDGCWKSAPAIFYPVWEGLKFFAYCTH